LPYKYVGGYSNGGDRSILPSTSLAECKTWIQGCFDWPINWNFAIELLPPSSSTISPSPCQDGPSVIGLIGAVRAPEIGYMLNYNYWGKGYATEALRAFMPMFFDWYSGGKQGRFEFAEAFTDTELVASQHILEKVGFRFVEKREKDFENPVLGLRDTLVYRMDRPDAVVDVAHMRS
jgi:RimJ/RimL family protein N-acetyltransferase